MKNNSIPYLICIVYLCFYKGFSSPLVNGISGYENPFLIYENPALINKQNGAPIGASFYYNPSIGDYIITCGFSESFTHNAFALCFKRDSQKGDYAVSTAFSSAYKKLSFGSSFHFLFSRSLPTFTFDVGLSYHFKEKRYVGLSFKYKDIFETKDPDDKIAREIKISTGGDIPRVKRMFYTIQGIGLFYDFKDFDYGYGGAVTVQKYFFRNPSLSLYSKGKTLYTHNESLIWDVEVMAGYHHFLNNLSFGVYGGYKYLSVEKQGRISLSLYVNPLYKAKIANLSCAIQLNTTTMTPNGDNINDNVIINIKGNFRSRKVKVKRWTLIITDEKDAQSNIIRTFSGGNIPPSSIVWDGRDNKERLVKNGSYYLKIIIIDTLNRVVSSASEEVTIY